MQKSLAATDDKVSHHIYDDIALIILSKLPLKSLLRFSCARKSWSLLLQNPYFMTLFRTSFASKDESYDNDTSILLQYCCDVICGANLFSLFGESFKNMIKLDWPNPYEDPYDFKIHGSVNGILCIQDLGRVEGIRCMEELGRYVLWNPATDEFQATPTSPFAFVSPHWEPLIHFHGFGYDPIIDDYKIIRHVVLFPTRYQDRPETWKEEGPRNIWKDEHLACFWEMYCLRSNSWKRLDIDIPQQYFLSMGDLVHLDGVCHWWASDSDDYRINYGRVYLVSFDLSREVFFKTYIPSNMDDASMVRELVVLNRTIGCISYLRETTTFHISILGEVGVKESWTKVFTVGPLSCVEYPIGVGKNGDIFFRKSDDDLVRFDLNTQRVEKLNIRGKYGCKIVIYKECLLPFPRLSN